LPPREIAENRQFKDLFEICLEAIITNGGPCAPTACPNAFAPAMPIHWKNSGLGRYGSAHLAESAVPLDPFGIEALFCIDDLLNEQSAARIWKQANDLLATLELSTQGILKKFNVKWYARPTIRPTT